MRKKFFKFSLISFIISLFLLAFNYFFFHFVTDEGIVWVKQAEAGKPFVSELIGDLAVLFLFASIIIFIYALIFHNEEIEEA